MVSTPLPSAQTAVGKGGTCGCGCGLPVAGRSKYYSQAHKVTVQAIRRRFRSLKRYAKYQKIPFELTHADVRRALKDLPFDGDNHVIVRANATLGFTPQNLTVRERVRGSSRKSVKEEEEGQDKPRLKRSSLERAIFSATDKMLNRAFRGGSFPLTQADVIQIYVRQKGLCFVTGEFMRYDRVSHHLAPALVKPEPGSPWSQAVLVCYVLERPIERWGITYLIQVCKSVIKHMKHNPHTLSQPSQPSTQEA